MSKKLDQPVNFEWGEKHRDYWLGLAASCGASDQQAKFAYAISTGMSQAAAARWAYGYKDDARSRGYALARTKRVTTLLTLAEADGWQSPHDHVSEEDKQKLLNSLMRSGDPAVRLRAIELSDKRRVAAEEATRAEQQTHDPLTCLDAIAPDVSPACAWVLAQKAGLGWKPKDDQDWTKALADLDTWRAAAIKRRDYLAAKRPNGMELNGHGGLGGDAAPDGGECGAARSDRSTIEATGD